MSSSATKKKISKVYGPDQTNDGEQVFWSVGYNCDQIDRDTENLGTYGIDWFHVRKDGELIASLNAKYTMGVEYEATK